MIGCAEAANKHVRIIAPEGFMVTGRSEESGISCHNPAASGQRIRILKESRTVVFSHCHHSRGAFGLAPEMERVVSFDEILGTRDFLTGSHRGTWLRILLRLGSPLPAERLASVFISTRFGRARVFASWRGFAEIRRQLHAITAAKSNSVPLSEDPRMIPVFVVLLLGVTAGMIWILL